MAGTHLTGPVYSKAGFISGPLDGSGQITQTYAIGRPAPTSIATAGNATYTAAQVLTGIILRDAAAGNRTDVLPTAALLVAALGGNSNVGPTGAQFAYVGLSFTLTIINITGTANTVQITMGSGGTAVGTNTLATIAQGASRAYIIRLTNVTAGAEAYSVYS